MPVRPFFDDASPYLNHPLLTAERTSIEVDRVLAAVGQPETVVDIGCGFGRHVVELTRRGIEVIGVDPSPTMIASARGRLAEADLEAHVCVGGFGDLGEVVATPVDLALVLFTTLGQNGADDATLAAQLAQTAAVVRSGGHVVIELMDRDRVLSGFVETEQLGPTTVTRSFDEPTSVLTERFDAPTGSFGLSVRLLATDELCALIEAAGLEIERLDDHCLAGADLAPPTLTTVFARR